MLSRSIAKLLLLLIFTISTIIIYPAEKTNNLNDISLYSFSQSNSNEDDPQVYNFKPDIVIRAWQKWAQYGLKPADYYFDYVKKCHDLNILFIGGGTASVVFREEFSTQKEFEDMITRDADNKFVEHTEIVPGAYRCSLANPKFRQHLINYSKIQIDNGIDGLFFDEANAGGYNGGKKWSFNGNEGFDDYFLKDFNRYLIEKYPGYTKSDWKNFFRMDDKNIIKPDIASNDLENNFNYRKYLKQNGWNNYPNDPSNPLSKEWGIITSNRPDPKIDNFREKYIMMYWKEIVTELKKYAKERYNKNILITSNGIFPYTDFNCFGLYNYNNDNNGSEVNYVPIFNGHLDGSKSLITIYKQLLKRNSRISGNVPLVLFIDWPCEMMNSYYKLQLSEKKDFWRIYAAESYACGLFFAFHLKTSMPDEPSAEKSGVLNFLKEYSEFYRINKDIYLSTEDYAGQVKTNNQKIEYNLRKKINDDKFFLHIINHSYNNEMIVQNNIKIKIGIKKDIKTLKLISPDFKEVKQLDFKKQNNMIEFTVDKLDFYNIIIIE